MDQNNQNYKRRDVLPPKKKVFGQALDARRVDEIDRRPKPISNLAADLFAFSVKLLTIGLIATAVQAGYQAYMKVYQNSWFSLSAANVWVSLGGHAAPGSPLYQFAEMTSPGIFLSSIAFVACIFFQFFLRRGF